MLYKPQIVTVTPGTPGRAGRAASYECSTYESGGASDGGGNTTPPGGDGSGSGSGIRFGGIGTPYTASNGETVYTDPDGDGYWNEEQIANAGQYTCTWGTSEPVVVNGATTYITAPFCTYTG